MIQPLGRKPSYSGKLITRAIDLYSNGVKPGYIRWSELQSTLEQEFPKEFKIKGEDRPNPKTVLDWVEKYDDVPVALKKLNVVDSSISKQTIPLKMSNNTSFIIPEYLFSTLILIFSINMCCSNIVALTMASCINDPMFNN
ncbi:MAG: hypothetical protein ACOWWR_03200 [Eubacteriales bacterium]